jgi:hypothetical protein
VSHPLTKEALIDLHRLSFDPGDPRNGSLYLGTPATIGTFDVDSAIADLRAARLWSDATPRQIADEQKPAYKAQLQLLEAVAYDAGFVVARFDHPRFPSDASRWREWLALLDARHARSID